MRAGVSRVFYEELFALPHILATIESSGDGLTEKTPWHILRFSHAEDLLAAKNIPVRESSVISRTVEYIPRVKRDENGVKGYYFDYGRIYWKKPSQMSSTMPTATGRAKSP